MILKTFLHSSRTVERKKKHVGTSTKFKSKNKKKGSRVENYKEFPAEQTQMEYTQHLAVYRFSGRYTAGSSVPRICLARSRYSINSQ